MRFTGVLVVLVGVVSAAPPPKETEADKLRRMWGETIDPQKDCSFSLTGGRLTIGIPGTPHKFTPDRPDTPGKAPRVRRTVGGDFDARVKVVSVTLPTENATGVLMTSGGIFLGTDDTTFVTISRYTTRGINGPGLAPQYLSQLRTAEGGDSALKPQPPTAEGKPVFVRLVRKGSTVTTHTSLDSETWDTVTTRTHTWPDKVYVGVFASHGLNHAVEGAFEDFRVTPLPK